MSSSTRGTSYHGQPQALSRRVDRLVTLLCRQVLPHASEDLVEDCRQEVSLLLWRIRDRLDRLPEEQRQYYTDACIRRSVWRTLRTELTHHQHLVPLDGAEPAEGLFGPAHEPASWSAGAWPRGLLDCVGDPRLAAALQALPDRDYMILHMHFVDELPDAEIAETVGVSSVALRKQRSRILARLRRSLRGAAASEPKSRQSPEVRQEPTGRFAA